MAKVVVQKGTLVGLWGALGSCVLALAFLLGRETARGPRAQAPPEAPAAQPLPAAQPPAPAVAQTYSGIAVPPPPAVPAAPPSPAVPAAAAAPAAAPAPARAAVAGYFQALDRIQPGQMAGGPGDLAKGLMEALSKGDTSGFDDMIRQAESARAALAALVPPAPCAAFHQESLASLDASIALLHSIRDSLTAPGAPASDFTAQAAGLQARAERLQREEKDLRQRYGVGN